MNRIASAVAVSLFASGSAMAYQVTGPVLDVTDTKIVVEKGKEKWEIARDKDTKISGELTKGSKVTVQYNMTATRIDVKDAGKTPAGKANEGKAAAGAAADSSAGATNTAGSVHIQSWSSGGKGGWGRMGGDGGNGGSPWWN